MTPLSPTGMEAEPHGLYAIIGCTIFVIVGLIAAWHIVKDRRRG